MNIPISSRLSLDQLENYLQNFKNFLAEQPQTEDVIILKYHISESIVLLTDKHKNLIGAFTEAMHNKYPELYP